MTTPLFYIKRILIATLFFVTIYSLVYIYEDRPIDVFNLFYISIVNALFMTWISIKYQKKQLKAIGLEKIEVADLYVKQKAIFTKDVSLTTLFDHLNRTLKSVQWKLDTNINEIEGRTKPSLSSFFGEKITIVLINDNTFEVKSKPNFFLTQFDAGVNRKNIYDIEKFIVAL
ncbi:hypothetical protein [Flammeovirga kamogawensis]|uniref:Uncharacterized protein n=1 Tax=Flammeovirga kamogawensis TaxID=373891 RepID=A0ABX8H2U4_9BACT|nr:hypothetical protein [Flammeovirga kamogawensis]MBB6462633.1 putative membrane protein [Flammeovirga kamogawensis]QWG09622.1 hypothetical protein KM029_23755 [Flammeovirga kamogawensis]TRX65136.1 hypothetical protein EO216_21655 [Flammeovirga kamogawensis]